MPLEKIHIHLLTGQCYQVKREAIGIQRQESVWSLPLAIPLSLPLWKKGNSVMLKGKINIHKHPDMARSLQAAQVTDLGTCPASSFIDKYARSPHAPTHKKGGRSLKQTIPSLMSRRSICSDYGLSPWISDFGYITISLYSRIFCF